jgi:hypothetical protein
MFCHQRPGGRPKTRIEHFVEGVFSGPLEVLVAYFHLSLREVAELTPLQRQWYLAIYAKQHPQS